MHLKLLFFLFAEVIIHELPWAVNFWCFIAELSLTETTLCLFADLSRLCNVLKAVKAARKTRMEGFIFSSRINGAVGVMLNFNETQFGWRKIQIAKKQDIQPVNRINCAPWGSWSYEEELIMRTEMVGSFPSKRLVTYLNPCLNFFNGLFLI